MIKDAAFSRQRGALFVLSLLEEVTRKTGFQLLHEVECRLRLRVCHPRKLPVSCCIGSEAWAAITTLERWQTEGRHALFLPVDPARRGNAPPAAGTGKPAAANRGGRRHQC